MGSQGNDKHIELRAPIFLSGSSQENGKHIELDNVDSDTAGKPWEYSNKENTENPKEKEKANEIVEKTDGKSAWEKNKNGYESEEDESEYDSEEYESEEYE